MYGTCSMQVNCYTVRACYTMTSLNIIKCVMCRRLAWLPIDNEIASGLAVPFTYIAMHAISSNDEIAGGPCVFLQL